jgi:hypothetical protein
MSSAGGEIESAENKIIKINKRQSEFLFALEMKSN